CPSGLQQHGDDFLFAISLPSSLSPLGGDGRGEGNLRERPKKFQLLRKSAKRPGEPTRPRAEGRIALLRIRTPIAAIVHVENAFVGRASGNVVSITPLPVIN